MSTESKKPRTRRCPQCGAAAVPIVYGYPGPELIKRVERGEVALGGCVVFDGQPTWSCPSCDTRFGGRPLRKPTTPSRAAE